MNTVVQRNQERARETMPWAQRVASTRRPRPMTADHVMALLHPPLVEHPDFHDGWSCIRERRVPLDDARHGSTILVTDKDADRLERMLRQLADSTAAQDIAALRAELGRARIVGSRSVPPDVITMNSRVICEDAQAGTRAELTLTYPADSYRDSARVSVLTPFGTALLGVSVGELLELPTHHARPLRVVGLPYQPEREGCFDV